MFNLYSLRLQRDGRDIGIFEIYVTWMAPKAAGMAVSYIEGASPRVRSLNLDQWISR